MVPTEAAMRIQQAWRVFVRESRHVVEECMEIARRLGNPVHDWNDFLNYQANGRIVVQINGDPASPFLGHSRFIVDGMFWELLLNTRTILEPLVGDNFARHAIRRDGAKVNYAGISCGREHMLRCFNFKRKIGRLMAVDRVLVLADVYTPYFKPLFLDEVRRFTTGPYTYGLQYNCHTLVRNVLLRMERVVISNR
jgi:hypothetical protein